MTAPTKTAPKPKAPAKPAVPANVPETDAELERKLDAAKAKPRGNSQYAPEAEQVAELLNQLRDEQGITRPFVIANIGPDANGRAFNDSMVWRAFNRKIHGDEVDAMMAFLEKVVQGELKVPGRSRKLKVEDLQSRVTEAIEVLSNEVKTAAQYRKVVDAALEILADVVPATDEAKADA